MYLRSKRGGGGGVLLHLRQNRMQEFGSILDFFLRMISGKFAYLLSYMRNCNSRLSHVYNRVLVTLDLRVKTVLRIRGYFVVDSLQMCIY